MAGARLLGVEVLEGEQDLTAALEPEQGCHSEVGLGSPPSGRIRKQQLPGPVHTAPHCAEILTVRGKPI